MQDRGDSIELGDGAQLLGQVIEKGCEISLPGHGFRDGEQ